MLLYPIIDVKMTAELESEVPVCKINFSSVYSLQD